MFRICAGAPIALLLLAAGCTPSGQSAQSAGNRESVRIVKVDEEAARLGFPAVFVSQEKPELDWSKAETELVNGKPVQVLRGAVVEVCGGNCDK